MNFFKCIGICSIILGFSVQGADEIAPLKLDVLKTNHPNSNALTSDISQKNNVESLLDNNYQENINDTKVLSWEGFKNFAREIWDKVHPWFYQTGILLQVASPNENNVLLPLEFLFGAGMMRWMGRGYRRISDCQDQNLQLQDRKFLGLGLAAICAAGLTNMISSQAFWLLLGFFDGFCNDRWITEVFTDLLERIQLFVGKETGLPLEEECDCHRFQGEL